MLSRPLNNQLNFIDRFFYSSENWVWPNSQKPHEERHRCRNWLLRLSKAISQTIFTFWRGVASSVLQRNYRLDSTLLARSGCAVPSQREIRERGRGIGC